MRFRQLCAPYVNSDGAILNETNQVDGNVLLYTGTMLVLLNRFTELGIQDKLNFVSISNNVTIQSGLIHRAYKTTDWEDQDDYVGLMAASYFCDSGKFSDSVVRYGRHHWYSWNNQSPGTWLLNGFFIRFSGWWALAKASSGRWLNLIDQLFASIGLLYSLFSSGSSDVLLSYLEYNVFIKKSWFTHPVVKLSCILFKFIYMKQNPSGIKTSYSVYFGSNYPFSNLPEGFF